MVAVDDDVELVYDVTVDQDIELHQLAGAEVEVLVVHRGVAAGHGLELVVEVHDDLGEWQLVRELDARLTVVAELRLPAAALLAQGEHVAQELDRQVDR